MTYRRDRRRKLRRRGFMSRQWGERTWHKIGDEVIGVGPYAVFTAPLGTAFPSDTMTATVGVR